MTAERRLRQLEGALSPKAATLLWLAEAHEYGSLEAYVHWLIDQPISAAPLERVPGQAQAAVVAAMRGQPRDVVRAAAYRAVRDAVFLVELVIRLNGAAVETSRTEGLRYAVLFWQMRALSAEASLSGTEASRRPSLAPPRAGGPGAPTSPPWSPGSRRPRQPGCTSNASISTATRHCSRMRSTMGRGCARVPSSSLVWVTAFRR